MSIVTGMNASNRLLSDTCKRKLTFALGQVAADEVQVGLETSIGMDQLTDPTLTNPTLVGTVELGLASDLVGLFGAQPVTQPSGAGQAAVGAITAQPLSYVGTADLILGDTGNESLNNQLASICAQVNAAITDLAALRTLANQLRHDLVTLGAIKGS
jgi:hypothetical protein